ALFGCIAFMMTAAESKQIAGFILLISIIIYIMIRRLDYLPNIVRRRHEIFKKFREKNYKYEFNVQFHRSPLIKFFLRKRFAIVFLDLAIVFISYYGSIMLVLKPGIRLASLIYYYKFGFVLSALFFLGTFIAGQCYKDLWRYIELGNIGRYVKSLSVAVLLTYFFSDYLLEKGVLSLNVFLAYWLILFIGILISRISYNFYYNFTKREITAHKDGEKVIIYGAGDNGEALLNVITKMDNINYRPIGFIDDDPEKFDLKISRFKIFGGVYELPRLFRKSPFSRIIISTPFINGNRETFLKNFCSKHGVTLSRFNFKIESY
ncbi:MAG: hypothetical protein ABIA63_07955, partial [bacterium]